jgi:hypothetical protein
MPGRCRGDPQPPAPSVAEKVRLRLAEAVLSNSEDSRDVEVLKRAALQRMALDYERRW